MTRERVKQRHTSIILPNAEETHHWYHHRAYISSTPNNDTFVADEE
jgi:hypothetical protein